MMVTIRNLFHNTEKRVRLYKGVNEIRGRRLREWKRALCCDGCQCSGAAGLLGDLYHSAVVDSDGKPKAWYIEYDPRTGEEYVEVWII